MAKRQAKSDILLYLPHLRILCYSRFRFFYILIFRNDRRIFTEKKMVVDTHTNTKGTLNISYSADDVDFFATIYENQCYLIPYNLCGKRAQRLRFVPTKNGQTKGILFAKDFKLENIIKTL